MARRPPAGTVARVRRTRARWPVHALGVCALGALALLVASGGVAGGAPSTSGSTVAVTVASSTSIDASGCVSGTLNVTDFGTVYPATSNVTSTDCSIVFGSSNDTAMLRAYQTDGVGAAMIGMSNGTLDTTFDTDGKVTTTTTSFSDYESDVAVQADGKVVIAGTDDMNEAVIMRYNTDGSLDTTFDGDGIFLNYFGGAAQLTTVKVQTDGKIVAAGTDGTDFLVVRVNANGTVDNTFDGDGKQLVTFPHGLSGAVAFDLALQPDGKIVVVGGNYGPTNWDELALGRLNSNGSLDTTFDTDGKQTLDLNPANHDDLYGVAVQPDGKIVAAGQWDPPSAANCEYVVVRYTSAGTLDTTFDTDGIATAGPGGGSCDIANSVGVLSNGKIVAAGYSAVATGDFGIARFTTSGALDATFDGDGKATIDFSGGNDQAEDLLVQPDDKVVLVGLAYIGSGGRQNYAVARYTTTGALDTTFDGDGKLRITVAGDERDFPTSTAMAPDGKLLLSGATKIGTYRDFSTLRLAGNGTVTDWAGSWGAAGLFGVCLHTLANATNTWTLAGNGNCTTALDANWRALPTAASKVASSASGVTNATATFRYGFKTTASQPMGTYVAQVTYEVAAPNA